MAVSRPVSWFVAFLVYLDYAILIAVGHIRDYYDKYYAYYFAPQKERKKGYAPLLKDFEDFYARRLYTRIKDCWNRPISSCPSSWIDIMVRESNDYNITQTVTDKTVHCLNLGSYNYLGFAENPEYVQKQVQECLRTYGVGTSTNRFDYGSYEIHKELEERIAAFVGQEDAIAVAMGFATNATLIPSLCEKGTLIVSDSENHSSIVFGARSSGAKVVVFPHNNFRGLEKIIRSAIVEGQPKTRRPWKKIIIIVEGIYSMEGEICPLKEIVEIKKKYKCYLYVDEAHSIGALGPNGKGICDFAKVNPRDVDILMGTFTKSFGSVGGYISGSKKLIGYLRSKGLSQFYCASTSPVCIQQIIGALDVIEGKDNSTIGKQKLKQLNENSVYFRKRLIELGFNVIGDEGSPVVCLSIYYPAAIAAFSRECYRRGVGAVVVGSPATDIIGSRARFCLSAAHTREDLDYGLKAISEAGEICNLKFHSPKVK